MSGTMLQLQAKYSEQGVGKGGAQRKKTEEDIRGRGTGEGTEGRDKEVGGEIELKYTHTHSHTCTQWKVGVESVVKKNRSGGSHYR